MKNKFEYKYWDNNKAVAGIDEVGRGCGAGPLVVSLVILNNNYFNESLIDSKKLSPKKREALSEEIKNNAIVIDHEVVSSKLIDQENNITTSTKNAINRLIKRNDSKFDICFIDYIKVDNSKTISFDKGEDKSLNIAAASICAKVFRDNLMIDEAQNYKQYKFESNKGYLTKYHREAIQKYGYCDIHRMTFKMKKS